MKISFYQQRNAKRGYYLSMAFRDPETKSNLTNLSSYD
jgi:hypothetical protein